MHIISECTSSNAQIFRRLCCPWWWRCLRRPTSMSSWRRFRYRNSLFKRGQNVRGTGAGSLLQTALTFHFFSYSLQNWIIFVLLLDLSLLFLFCLLKEMYMEFYPVNPDTFSLNIESCVLGPQDDAAALVRKVTHVRVCACICVLLDLCGMLMSFTHLSWHRVVCSRPAGRCCCTCAQGM